MRLDEKATAERRKRHEHGRRRLNDLFNWTEAKTPFVPQTGHAVGVSWADRLLWRTWRDEMLPARVKARRRRKLSRAARKRNRS